MTCRFTVSRAEAQALRLRGLKNCVDCGPKPITDFSPSGRGGRYRCSRCRPCAAALKRKWCAEHPEHLRAYRAEFIVVHRDSIAAQELARRAARPEYWHWKQMNARCHNPAQSNYHKYGARGISVSPEWRGPGGFDKFFQHIGARPGRGYSVDRIDGTRGYEPGNVRWATAKEQARNTCRVRLFTFEGRSQCIAAWAQEAAIPEGTLRKRLATGWEFLDALTAPVGVRRNNSCVDL